jgi:hypothetical protein
MIFRNKPIGTVSYLGGLPCLLESFCWSWGQMLLHSTEVLCDSDTYIHTDRATFSDHGPARNSLVNRMQGNWLLQLDTDHSFEPDLLVRMLDRMEVNKIDVMLGMYQFKRPPYSPVLFHRDGDTKFVAAIAGWGAKDGGSKPDIVQVSSSGGGCHLVRREVYDRIERELRQRPYDRVEGLSEDHSFFWRCKELKIPIYCDMRIECNHLEIRPITIEDFDPTGMSVSEGIPVAGMRD